ncbi:type II toxin-antitoxin system VapC family toxin [Cellulomonas soli]|uniref:PIN domain-containing protein n=1 Tax=Cellulomonas soli TaxID=931535 RepID=A0A512PIR8_9CELL|nr:type II toxin-antitoxin system VapC family toxin [Cellulomonas soli]NYI58858.1 putative nucleic acid-binding protein [Cellulomonas soli]GEP71099.1 hypothetical protein CSO01_38140 [Cellulomonas soli]
MPFVRIDDALPAPQAYLRAGLARPQSGPGILPLSAGNAVGSRAGADRMLDRPAPPTVGSQSMTVLDEAGAPCAVVSVPSGQFLSYPALADPTAGEALGVRRAPNGMPIVLRGQRQPGHGLPAPVPVDVETARVVTVDLSVILAGVDPALFAPDDALFVSAALAIEMAVMLGEREQSGELFPERGYRPWDRSIPVPVDHLVLRMYAQIVSDVRLHYSTELDRTDLLCAATAIIYDAPLYTTKPEAYKVLKNGLKVIKYGPTRNKAARRPTSGPPVTSAPAPAAPARASARPAPADPAEAAAALRDAYTRGEPFDQIGPVLLEAAGGAPDALAEAITEILEAVHDDLDPTWRIALLDRAEHLAPALRQADASRAGLLTALAQLNSMRTADPARQRQADAALQAYGQWAHWPDDAPEEVLDDLEDGDDDPSTLAWYRVFLTMAGVPGAQIDQELADVTAGRSLPSRERIEELRPSEG